jgi:catechol 2,3-dioxygenase-like lactoylglutathione lyase family enzyme
MDHEMSDNEHLPGIVFGRIASTVAVRDLPRALGFYVGVLGMRVTFENGDPVGFAILRRDAANCTSQSLGSTRPAPTTLPTYW